ncbi:protein FAM13A isoform X2 [Ischnura elegans]|uniref:protein FAM13A isoform X2 n=1 Tax=Ischnura elegans TaxID=197161 RepID=UPI001ED878BF|nr:protein FAM13A isoform X2 [Ischnura elegans]
MRRPWGRRPSPEAPPPAAPSPAPPPLLAASAFGRGGGCHGGAAPDDAAALLAEDGRGDAGKSGRGSSSGGCGGDSVLTVGQAISSRLRRLLSQPSRSATPGPHHHQHLHSGAHFGHLHANTTGMPRGSPRADDGPATTIMVPPCPPDHVPGATGDVPAGQQHPHYHRKRKERQESLSLSQDRKVIRSNSEERPVVELEVEVSVSEIEVDSRVGKSTESNGIIRDMVSSDCREQKKTKNGTSIGNGSILRRVSSHEDVTTARHNSNNQLHNHIQQQHNGKNPIVIITGKDKDEKKSCGNLKGSGKSFFQELSGDAPLLAPRSLPQPLHEHNSSQSPNSTPSIIPSSPKEDDSSSHLSPSSSARVGSPSPSSGGGGTTPPVQQGGSSVAQVSQAVSTPFFFLPMPVGEEEEEHERRRSSERFASFPRASTPRGGKRDSSSGRERQRESRRPRRQRVAKVWKDVADGDAGGGSSSSKENEEEEVSHEETVSQRDFDKEALGSGKSHISHQYSRYPSSQQPHSETLASSAGPMCVGSSHGEESVPPPTVHSFMQLHPRSSPVPTSLDDNVRRLGECESLGDEEKDLDVGGEKGLGSSASSPTSSSTTSSSSSSPNSSTSSSSSSSSPDDPLPQSAPSPSVSVPQLDLASLLRRMDTTEEPLTSRGPWLGGAKVHADNEDFAMREMRYFDHGEVPRRGGGDREAEDEGHVVPLSPRNSMVLTRGAGGGRCGAYLDPNVPPSPPTEHHLPHLKRLPDPLASDSPATILTKQVSRQINSLKKKIKRYEEEFENQFGYRPSHADKLANRDVKKWIAELGKLRKDLKQMKEDPHSPMLASAKTLGISFPIPVQKDGEGKTQKMEETLNDVQKRLSEKRSAAGRPEELESLSREQLQEEKLALQKALLHLESLHGRPSSREERDLVRPLYDRYRMLKRMVIRSGPSKLKDSVTELATIHEHEAMDFTPQSQSEDAADEVRVPGLKEDSLPAVGLVPSAASGISSELDKVEDRKVPDIGENLHALPLIELLSAQREAREEKKRLRRALREFEEEFALLSGRRATKDERPPALEQTAVLYKRTRAKLRLLEALVAKHTGGIPCALPLDA